MNCSEIGKTEFDALRLRGVPNAVMLPGGHEAARQPALNSRGVLMAERPRERINPAKFSYNTLCLRFHDRFLYA